MRLDRSTRQLATGGRSQGISVGGLRWIAVALLSVVTAACAKSRSTSVDFAAVDRSTERIETGGGHDAVSMVTKRHLSNFRLCAKRSMKLDNRALVGSRMELTFTVLPSGRARHVRVLTRAFRSSNFASCVERIIYWIRFPPFRGDPRTIRFWMVLDDENPLLGS